MRNCSKTLVYCTILLLFIFISGYFIYDFVDLLIHGKIISNWEVTLHHIAVSKTVTVKTGFFALVEILAFHAPELHL